MNRPRALVVEDKPHILELVASTLQQGCDVTRAGDGGRALEIIATTEPFDVVVTDVRMPRADGFEVLSAVRKRSADTQVVLLTAYASVPDAVAAIRQGAYDYLEKPFDPDDLSLTVARALEQRRHRDAERGGAGEHGAPLQHGFRAAVAEARDKASRDYLVALMREFGGNVTQASRRAGLERESLHRVLRRYGVRSEEFKPKGEEPRARGDEPKPPPEELKARAEELGGRLEELKTRSG